MRIYRLIIIIIFFTLISCADSDTKLKETDLCKDTICGSGYQCDKTDGNCKKIENYCINDTQCEEDEICDKSINQCKFESSPYVCEKHEDCRSWEICDFDISECKPREGMCNISDSCTTPPFLICNVRTHRCMDPGSCLYNFCESYEVCKEDEECHLRDGFCMIDDDCKEQFPYDVCNLETHSCIRPLVSCTSYTDCDINYQYCDNELCKASEGKCRSNLDCVENSDNGNKTICNKDTNDCITPENQNCKVTGCDFWQECNEDIGVCELPTNRCNNDNDCTGAREVCNQAHYCEADDCTTHGCDWWKHCIRDTGECQLYDAMCDTDTDCVGLDPYTNCSLAHTCGTPLDLPLPNQP